MTRLIVAALASAVVLTGCENSAKNTDPKPAAGSTADPRLQPAGIGGGGAGAPEPGAAKPQAPKNVP